MSSAVKPRTAWSDRFSRPDIETLIDEMESREIAAWFEHARTLLGTTHGMREELAWHGLPWRWSLAFRWPGHNERPVAYLVPDPKMPRIAIPLANCTIAQLTLKRIQKTVRDGILRGAPVGSVRWCQWDLTAKSLVDDVIALALMRVATAGAA